MTEETVVTNIVARSDFSDLIGDLTKVSSRLSVLQSQLTTTNRALANQAAQMQKSFANTLRSTGQFSTHFVSLSSDVDKFGHSLDSGKMKLGQYYGAWKEHSKTAGGLIRDLAKQQVMMQNAVLQPLGKNAQGLMQFNVHVPQGLNEIANKTKIASQEMKIMNKVIQDGANQVINWGKNTQWAGRQLTMGLTLPIVAFGASAQKAFLEADQQLVRLTKVYGGVAKTSAAELKKVRSEVSATARDLASAYGASYKDTIALAADIAATGKTGNELLKSTAETTRLSILGEVDRQEAMKATLAIQTAFKQNTTQLGESINFLNAVENQTSTSLQDLVEAIPKAGPVIQAMGGSIKDLALYMTAMKEGGISASEGANALKSAMASLVNPTKVAKDMFKGMGIDLGGIVTRNAGNLTGTILELQGALDKLDPLKKQQAIEQLFGKFQFARMNALFANLGKQGSQTLAVMDLMKASSKDLATIASREMTTMTESASGKYKRALETLKADMAGVGDSFLSVSTKVLNVIDGIIKFFNHLPKPLKSVMTFVAGLTAIAGPIIMLTGLFANFFGYIAKGLFHFKALLKGGEGFKLLTPEILAAEKAGTLMETTFYDDAKAAAVLKKAIANLTAELSLLEVKANSATVAIGPAIQTTAGSVIQGASQVVVNKEHPLVGQPYTRQMAHLVPAGTPQPGTIFGVVPNPGPVNQRIGKNLQTYASETMPMYPGITSIRGINNGIIPTEAAKWHSMVGALAMQSETELKTLRTEVNATKTVTSELAGSYEALLPEMTKITSLAASRTEAIVGELKASKITVDAAKAQVTALNIEIETMMGQAASQVAIAQGRSVNLTTVPLTSQPTVTAAGKSNMKELFHKGTTASLVDNIAGALGVRTSGAGYSRETTLPRVTVAPFLKRNSGGHIYDPRKHGAIVPGDTSINYDNTPAMLPLNGFVLNQKASLNPRNKDIVALADVSKNDGTSNVPAIVTPGETVYTPEVLNKNPGLRETLVRVNKGYAYGGDIRYSKPNYGKTMYPGEVVNSLLGMFGIKTRTAAASILPGKFGMILPESVNLNLAKGAGFGGASGKILKQYLNEPRRLKDLEEFLFAQGVNEQTVRRIQSSVARVMKNQIFESSLYKDPELGAIGMNTIERFVGNLEKRYPGISLALQKERSLPGRRDRERAPSKTTGKVRGGRNTTKIQLGSFPSGHGSGAKYSDEFGTGQVWAHFEDAYYNNNLESLMAFESSKVTALRQFENNLSGVSKAEKERQLESFKKAFKAPEDVINKILSNTSTNATVDQFGGGLYDYTKRWPQKQQFHNLGFNTNLFNDQPSHGPLYIGLSKNLKQYAGYDNNPKTAQRAYYKHPVNPTQFGFVDVPPIGTPTEKAMYYIAQYQSGNKSVMATQADQRARGLSQHPLSVDSMTRLLSSKYSGKAYRGILNSRIEDSLPPHMAELFKEAEKTGDYSKLINQNFVMRRSSFSKDKGIADFFGLHGHEGFVIDASVNNRNVTDVGSLFPNSKFHAPMGQKWGNDLSGNTKNEKEILLGGSFKVLDFKNGVMYVQSIPGIEQREKGGPVNSGQPYLVGEKGPELFVPKNAGGIISHYELGGLIRASKYGYGLSGNPAIRAQQEEARRLRAASFAAMPAAPIQSQLTPLQQARLNALPFSTKGYGMEKITTNGTNVYGLTGNAPYSPGLRIGNQSLAKLTGFMSSASQQISMSMYALGTSLKKDALNIGNNLKAAGLKTKAAFMSMGESISSAVKSSAAMVKSSALSMANATRSFATMSNPGLAGGMGKNFLYGQSLLMNPLGIGRAGASSWWPGRSVKSITMGERFGGALGRRAGAGGMPLGGGFVGSMVGMSAGSLIGGKLGGTNGAGIGSMVGMMAFMGGGQLLNKIGLNYNAVKASKAEGYKLLQKAGKLEASSIKAANNAQELRAIAEAKKVSYLEKYSGTARSFIPKRVAGAEVQEAFRAASAAEKGAGVVAKEAAAMGRLAANSKVAAPLLKVVLGGAARYVPLVGEIASAAQLLWIWKRHAEDVGKAHRAVFGPTSKSLEEVGLKYVSINDKLKAYHKQLQLTKEAALSATRDSKGNVVKGLTLNASQVEAGVANAKKNAKETVQDFNKSSGGQKEVIALAASLKQQYVSAGMSIQEATNKVYVMIKASDKAGMAMAAITSDAFKSITDSSTAADYAIKVTTEAMANGTAKAEELATGVNNVMNSLDQYRNSLVGTKDKAGNVIDDNEALRLTLEKVKKIKLANNKIDADTLAKLKSENLELGGILGKNETIASTYAKIALSQSPISTYVNVGSLTPKEAPTVAAGLEGYMATISKQINTKGVFAGLGKTIDSLKSKYTALSKAATSYSTVSYDKIISQQQDLIKGINKELELRLKILDAQQKSEDFATSLKKEQLAYQNALASGDMQGAAEAQLNIQKLIKDNQIASAKQALQDRANARIDAANAKIDAANKGKTDAQTAAESAGTQAIKAQTEQLALQNFNSSLTNIAAEYPIKGNPTKDQKNTMVKDLNNALTDLKKSGDAGSKFVTDFLGKYKTADQQISYLKDLTIGKDGKSGALAIAEASTTFGSAVKEFAKAVAAMPGAGFVGGSKSNPIVVGEDIQKSIYGANFNLSLAAKSWQKTGGAVSTGPVSSWNPATMAVSDRRVVQEWASKQDWFAKGVFFAIPIKGGKKATFVVNEDETITKVETKATGGSVNGYAPGGKPKGTYAPGMGGYVRGAGTPTSDSILTQMGSGGFARLSDTEYVHPASAVSYYGTHFMDLIRSRSISKRMVDTLIGKPKHDIEVIPEDYIYNKNNSFKRKFKGDGSSGPYVPGTMVNSNEYATSLYTNAAMGGAIPGYATAGKVISPSHMASTHFSKEFAKHVARGKSEHKPTKLIHHIPLVNNDTSTPIIMDNGVIKSPSDFPNGDYNGFYIQNADGSITKVPELTHKEKMAQAKIAYAQRKDRWNTYKKHYAGDYSDIAAKALDSATALSRAMGGAIPGYSWGGLDVIGKGIKKLWHKFEGSKAGDPLTHSMTVDLLKQVGTIGQFEAAKAGIAPKPTKEQVVSLAETTGIPSVYRVATNKKNEGPLGKTNPDAQKLADLAGVFSFLTPGKGAARAAVAAEEAEAERLAIAAAQPSAVAARIKSEIAQSFLLAGQKIELNGKVVSPYKNEQYPGLGIEKTLSSLKYKNVSTKIQENITNLDLNELLKKSKLQLTQPELSKLIKGGKLDSYFHRTGSPKDPALESLRSKILSEQGLNPREFAGFDTSSTLYKSTRSVDDILNSELYHAGQLPEIDGSIALSKNKTNSNNWFGAPLFATEGKNQALSYLIKNLSENPSLYKIKSNLEPHEVLDLRHGALPLAEQHPYVWSRMVRDLSQDELRVKKGENSFSRDELYRLLLAQEGGADFANVVIPGKDRLFPFHQISGLSPWLNYVGIKGIVHRGGTVLKTPDIFGKDMAAFKATEGVNLIKASARVKDTSAPGHDVLAYTRIEDSIASIKKSAINRDSFARMLTTMDTRGLGSNEMEKIVEQLLLKSKGKGFKVGYATGGSFGDINAPRYNIPNTKLSVANNQMPGYNNGGSVHNYDVGGMVINTLPHQDAREIAHNVVQIMNQQQVAQGRSRSI